METYLSSPLVKSFLAGSFSGTCSTIMFQPLDLVKTRIQSPLVFGASNGVVSVMTNVVKHETLLGLWKGVAPSLSRTVPGIGVYFSSLHALKSSLGTDNPSAMESLMLGASARSVSGVAMLPITVIKTRYESGRFAYTSMKDALVKVYQFEGIKGLYSGFSATLLRDAPFSGFYLMFYTQIKKAAKNSPLVDGNNSPVLYFSCGILAGFFASIVTQPADVIKTQMQLYPHKYRNMTEAIVCVYNADGASGFLRGLVPRTMRRSMMAAMAWTVYEQIMVSYGLK